MAQIVVVVGPLGADGIGVDFGLYGFDQGAHRSLACIVDSRDGCVDEIQGFIIRSHLKWIYSLRGVKEIVAVDTERR